MKHPSPRRNSSVSEFSRIQISRSRAVRHARHVTTRSTRSPCTAPYGHNGYFTTLRDVVRFYVTRDTNPELWYPTDAAGNVQKFNDLPTEYQGNVNTEEVPYDRKLGEQPRLTDDEIDAVVAFLNALTDR